MTYCCETRDKKNAVRERVNKRANGREPMVEGEMAEEPMVDSASDGWGKW
jgi:hypothetical protein